jgi:uncharacterized membrane protein YkvA (DUF1232 family)
MPAVETADCFPIQSDLWDQPDRLIVGTRSSSMKSTPSPSLSRFLSENRRTGHLPNPSAYITDGTANVTADDLTGLQSLLPQVRSKAEKITESMRLRRRIELLATYFEETSAQAVSTERRETAFVLYYFLKGFDLIPDTTPTIGLLDDALLVETVLRRNQAAVHGHWVSQKRPWSNDV